MLHPHQYPQFSLAGRKDQRIIGFPFPALPDKLSGHFISTSTFNKAPLHGPPTSQREAKGKFLWSPWPLRTEIWKRTSNLLLSSKSQRSVISWHLCRDHENNSFTKPLILPLPLWWWSCHMQHIWHTESRERARDHIGTSVVKGTTNLYNCWGTCFLIGLVWTQVSCRPELEVTERSRHWRMVLDAA